MACLSVYNYIPTHPAPALFPLPQRQSFKLRGGGEKQRFCLNFRRYPEQNCRNYYKDITFLSYNLLSFVKGSSIVPIFEIFLFSLQNPLHYPPSSHFTLIIKVCVGKQKLGTMEQFYLFLFCFTQNILVRLLRIYQRDIREAFIKKKCKIFYTRV